jgi:amino acid adenylation domain-containing protein
VTAKPALRATPIEARFAWTPFADDALDRSITERFEDQVRSGPERLAIRTAVRTVTYDALNRAANRLARTIVAQRGTRSEAVALLFDDDAFAIAAMLAVLKAGKFYVVLDAQFPPERLAYMLADSQSGLIVADEANVSFAATLTREGLSTIVLSDIDSSSPAENLDVHSPPDALAMLLYTSGSTGMPKGVMHSHRNILAEARNLTNGWCASPDDRWLVSSSLSFANAVRTIYGALLNGGSLYPYNVKRDGFGSLPDWLRQNGISIVRTLPTAFRNFMATLPDGLVFEEVRVLSISGEPMYRDDVEAFNAHFAPSCVLAHGFGPTECGMVCLNYVPHAARIDSAKLEIGTPLPDKDVLLVDEDGREVAEGGSGEIWVRSRYIALGYWRDPDRTRASFRSDPNDPEVRLYKTGDLGTRGANGSFMHDGRRDSQVKIRGYRIDVAEIEVAIRALDEVRDVAVVAQERAGEKRLIAYYVASTIPPVTPARIREAIARRIPRYMVPAAIVRIEALPQTPTGKTDRLRLSSQSHQRPQLDSVFVAASTQAEKDLVVIWSGILVLDDIGIHDNFFELGGDSLAAARVVAQIQKRFDSEVTMTEFFQMPTVAELGRIVEVRESTVRAHVPAITRGDRSGTS